MRNTWTICSKELRSYFVSPVAYLLLTMFGLIFGFFFWNALGYFVIEGMEMQLRGQTFPMNVNEQIIRPLLSNVSVVGLFFIPMITMRLFAEEKRTGTMGDPLVATAEWGYVRLRRDEYTDAVIAEWAEKILAQPWKEAFVFLKHDEGDAPSVAKRLIERLDRG